MNNFKIVTKVTAKRDRLYHPDLYQAGDTLTIAIHKSVSGNWIVDAWNDDGIRVNGLREPTGRNEQHARRVAKQFAKQLSE